MPKQWKPARNSDLIKGVAFLLLLVVISHFKAPVQEAVKKKQPPSPIVIDAKAPTNGVMVASSGQAFPISQAGFKKDRVNLRVYQRRVVGMMAMASDHNYYYANGYLQGYVPFEVNDVYTAMNFIGMRLRYSLDEKLFAGAADLWQTSKEAYQRMRGDCEDHAILLADWLATLGYDVKVAVGMYKGGGHAWVVWFDKGVAKIIEATSKRNRRTYPLATMMQDYQAFYMFDREGFWMKNGGFLVEDYKRGWFKTASFRPL